MIIDSPIISGSYAATGSLNQVGNVVITGSLTVTEQITGSINTASFAAFAISASNALTASYLSNYIPPFPYTGSAGISGSLSVNGNITSNGTLTAQTLVVQVITSSVDFVTGSTRFGSELTNTHLFTGSVAITGSLAVNGSTAILTNQTGAMSVATASYVANAVSASFSQTAISASYASNVPATASFAVSASQALSASYALTASYSANVPETASFAVSASQAQNATSASYSAYALTSSYSLAGSGFPFSGSAVITGSLLVTNLSSSGVSYLVADSTGFITAQSGSAAIFQTQIYTASAGQTTFAITNGYATGLINVFVNGTKLNPSEYTDTNGTTIVLATGSFVDDIVEFNKYLPASGVANNTLRQLTTFTASAAQTVFSASYTPGLLDIYYNGSHLSNGDFTANNGTFITLATGSAAGDILDVFVYSYQVGAFSGIGGAGVANQVAYFGTTNSITGSPNFTISGSTMTVTGSLTVSGSGTFTNIGPAVFSGSIVATSSITTPVVNSPLLQNGSQYIVQDTNTGITAIQNGANTWGFYPGGQFYPAGVIGGSSYGSNQLNVTNLGPVQLKGTLYGAQIVTSPDQETTYSYAWNFKNDGDLELPAGKTITGSLFGTASYAANANLLDGLDSSVFVPTGSFNTFSSSILTYTGSTDSRLSSIESTTGSLNAASGSAITRLSSLESKTGSYATTGSNIFVDGQYLSSSFNPTGFSTTASLYTDGGLRVTKDAYISGTLYLNNVTVYGTQSVCYITSSQLNISSNLISVNTATPSVRFGGLAVYDSGSTGLTGSILWDSETNHWIYSNPSGSSYSGGMFISGPRTSTLGSETGTTACMLLAGQGGDHLTSSMIYHSSTATCIPNTLIGSAICSTMLNTSCVGIGTTSPSRLLHVLAPTGNHAYGRIEGGLGGYGGFLELMSNSEGSGTDSAGRIDFYMTSGNRIATIAAQRVSGGANYGTLIFSTADNSTTPTERFRIASTGVACFACELTAKTLGTNDLILNNLNYECANYVDGTRGSWLIQEGACDLFIINQVSCKKYKFNLIEIK
jgi:hypothetical protein